MNEKLIIFVRAPRVGVVKTRLATTLGPEAAVEVYKTLLKLLFNNLISLSNLELRFTPDEARAEIRAWLQPGWELAPQGNGDLSERLIRAFQESFDAGFERVVVIGSDCPAVLASDIKAAWAGLQSHDVVLGPATDGGYWLIGLRGPQPRLFQDIPWSTADVLENTLRRIRESGLTVRCLRSLADIDTAADWEEFRRG